MTQSEEIELARNFRDISNANRQFAEEQSWNLSNEFTRLEVQIAAILFGLSGLFLGSLNDPTKVPVANNFGMRLTFSSAMFALLVSFGLGLLHLKRNEKFWDELHSQRIIRFWKWDKAVRKETSFKEAQAFHEGTALDKGKVIRPPMWTWLLQTICLSVAVVLLFVLSVIYLFR